MDKWERKCKELCHEIVMSVGHCEACGSTVNLEQHHGIFLSNQRLKLNPELKYDPDLQFCLCADSHKYRPYSPHVDNDSFLQKMTDRGGHQKYKAQKIIQTKQGELILKDPDYERIYLELKGE